MNVPLGLPNGRLVQVTRTRATSSRVLLVSFNSHWGMAYAQPQLPFETSLESYSKVAQYDSHLIFFAEENKTWYLEHEARIVANILKYVIRHDIDTVVLIGRSAGGYASLRLGMRLDQLFVEYHYDARVIALPGNPQTGFRPELLERIRAEMIQAEWNMEDFGTKPPFLSPIYVDHFRDKTIEILDYMKDYRSHKFSAILMYDDLNPIERIFSGDLSRFSFIQPCPVSIGIEHGPSCNVFTQVVTWQVLDKILPIDKLDPAEVAGSQWAGETFQAHREPVAELQR